jgi:hypothetical protein
LLPLDATPPPDVKWRVVDENRGFGRRQQAASAKRRQAARTPKSLRDHVLGVSAAKQLNWSWRFLAWQEYRRCPVNPVVTLLMITFDMEGDAVAILPCDGKPTLAGSSS